MATQDITIRPTVSADLADIDRVYDLARLYMRRQGNMSQWADGYPTSKDAARDMALGRSFVVERRGRVVATFCLMREPEPTYAGLPDEDLRPYVTLHRVASDGTVGGILHLALSFARRAAPGADIRIDTHADNAPMLRAIAREGFSPCGTIRLADGSPREAFCLPAADQRSTSL